MAMQITSSFPALEHMTSHAQLCNLAEAGKRKGGRAYYKLAEQAVFAKV